MTLVGWCMALLLAHAVSFSENQKNAGCRNLTTSSKDICCFISEQFFPAIGFDQHGDFFSRCQNGLPSAKSPDDDTAHRAWVFLLDWYYRQPAASNASSSQFLGLDESSFCPADENDTDLAFICEQWHCLADRNCKNAEQQRVAGAFLRRAFELYYYASNLQDLQWIDDFDNNRFQVLNQSVLCLYNASCCNVRVPVSRYYISAENLTEPVRFVVKDVFPMPHCDFMRKWILPNGKLLTEYCDEFSGNMTPQACYVHAAYWCQLDYRAAYSELGLLTQIHYLLQSDSNELVGRLEYLGLQPLQADPRRINLLRRLAAAFAILLQLAGISIVTVNSYVLYLIHRTRKEQANMSSLALSHRVTVFLRNILALNIAFGLEEAVAIAVTFLIGRMSSHGPVMFNPRNHDSIWWFAVRSMTAGTPSVFQLISMVRVCLRTSLQLCSLLLFIFFGTFQALPLILPFKMRKSAWLEYPGYAAAMAWAAGMVLACIICIPNDVYYKFYVDYRTDSTFTASQSKKLEEVLAGEALDVCQNVASVSFVAVCSFLSIAVFVYALIVWKVATVALCKPAIVRQCSTERCTASAVNGIVNVCLALLILLLSVAVYVGFLAHVHLDSNRVMMTSYQDKYGIVAATHYISFYLAARLLVSMEPLATPILILCRYNCLSVEMRRQAEVLLLYGRIWNRRITRLHSPRAREIPSSAVASPASSVATEADTAAAECATTGAKHNFGNNREAVSGRVGAMRTCSSAFTISCRSELEETTAV